MVEYVLNVDIIAGSDKSENNHKVFNGSSDAADKSSPTRERITPDKLPDDLGLKEVSYKSCYN